MPKLGQQYGRRHDSRFALHGRQPRASKLDRRQLILCRNDPAYAAALRLRVSDPVRWEAFLGGRPHYEGKVCPKCCRSSRRTRDGSCYVCLLAKNRSDWEQIQAGIMPKAGRSRAGYLDMQERSRRERAGECLTFSVGRFTAQQYPTGRLAVQAPEVHIDNPDLSKLPGPTVVSLCRRFPELRDVLRWAGWSVPA
ncbi:MAG: hypothetical protein JWQ21_3194 [Herminiimonas sp.]|nr:hypothetical protein [Herminiimonas sp.]